MQNTSHQSTLLSYQQRQKANSRHHAKLSIVSLTFKEDGRCSHSLTFLAAITIAALGVQAGMLGAKGFQLSQVL